MFIYNKKEKEEKLQECRDTTNIIQTEKKYKMINDLNLEKIYFTVKDTGAGIKEENLKNLFKFTDRIEIITKEKQNNLQCMGLGLLISNQLLGQLEISRQADTYINVISKINEGSTFSFSIFINDFEDIEENTGINQTEHFEAKILFSKIGRFKQKKSYQESVILIVDDEPFCLDVINKYLLKMGIKQIKMAKNGLHAIEIIKEDAKIEIFYDIIVMDCNMPIMDGFEATKIIREMVQRKAIEDVAIIALTANVATADETACKEAGMNYYLKKPVNKDVFSAKILEILAHAHST